MAIRRRTKAPSRDTNNPWDDCEMLDIMNLMKDMSRDRPVFHSEADFQHALAWSLNDAVPGAGVRLEFKPFSDEPMHLDIWLPGIGMAVELKYKTRRLRVSREGESFSLRDQAAQDISRYDFLKDIERLERLREFPNARVGFAVLLTNDRTLWKPPSRPTTIDAAFRLYDGRSVSGKMAWSERAAVGTTRHREAPIRLNGSYDLHWQDYSDVGDGPNRRFRYVAVRTIYSSHPASTGGKPRRT